MACLCFWSAGHIPTWWFWLNWSQTNWADHWSVESSVDFSNGLFLGFIIKSKHVTVVSDNNENLSCRSEPDVLVVVVVKSDVSDNFIVILPVCLKAQPFSFGVTIFAFQPHRRTSQLDHVFELLHQSKSFCINLSNRMTRSTVWLCPPKQLQASHS